MRILLIGCGKMGNALYKGWLKKGFDPSQIVIIDPIADLGSSVIRRLEYAPADFIPDIVLFAVKPQAMTEVVPLYKKYNGALFISIMAGKTIASMEAGLGTNQAIIRAMPNIAALAHEAITICIANPLVTAEQKQQAEEVFKSIGLCQFFTDESLMDVVTAISGSGPAYVFLLAETLAKAGERSGLSADASYLLARQTIIGAAALLRQYPQDEPTRLREQVTSPGGTTEAALKILLTEGAGLQELIDKAVTAAIKRGAALNS